MVTVSRLPYPITITAGNLVLREWHFEDLAALVDLLDDPDIARWTPMPTPFDVAAGTAYLERAYRSRVSGERIHLAITVDGVRPLGEVLLFGFDAGLRRAEIGYVVGARYRQRGLASGALALLSGYAQSTLTLSRLLLRIDPGNTASVAVARRCGYRLTDEPPMLQAGAHGSNTLDTWELVTRPPAHRLDRLRNVAARRYDRRG